MLLEELLEVVAVFIVVVLMFVIVVVTKGMLEIEVIIKDPVEFVFVGPLEVEIVESSLLVPGIVEGFTAFVGLFVVDVSLGGGGDSFVVVEEMGVTE